MGRKYLRLLALMGACACLTSCSLLPEEEPVRVAPVLREVQPEVYELVKVQRGDLVRTEKVSVKYVPVQKETLSFKLLGEYVDVITVNVGDTVEKGQLLGRLRVDDIEDRIADARNNAAELELRLNYLEQEYALEKRRSEVRTEGQSAEAIRKDAEAVDESFAERRKSLENQLTLQQITLDTLDEELEKRLLRAPFAGTVTYVREYEEGHLTAYAESAVTIADSTVAVFRAETKNWAVFHEGDRYPVEVESEEYVLQVVSEESLGIEAEEKVEGKKAYVYFCMDETILGLEEGDYGVIQLELDRRDDVLYVPENAVMTAGDIQLVYYQREDGLKGYKEVKTGVTIGKYTEIVSGLAEGEEIIAG